MSQKLQAMLLGGLITLNLVLAIVLTTLVMSEFQSVQADEAVQPVVAAVEAEAIYQPLISAPEQRNISQQQFTPLP